MSPAKALLTAAFYLGANAGAPLALPIQPLSHGRITSDYGMREDPLHGKTRFHEGVDLAAAVGSAVRAVAPGQVIFAGYHAGYGRVIGVRHSETVTTLYAHCWALRAAVGDLVKAGTVIGYVGDSGRTTGPHLHFEVRVNGMSVDPLAVLQGRKRQLKQRR
jgi:murein DD-endopeptidase MepM/ murein hydrolase activator NlpD